MTKTVGLPVLYQEKEEGSDGVRSFLQKSWPPISYIFQPDPIFVNIFLPYHGFYESPFFRVEGRSSVSIVADVILPLQNYRSLVSFNCSRIFGCGQLGSRIQDIGQYIKMSWTIVCISSLSFLSAYLSPSRYPYIQDAWRSPKLGSTGRLCLVRCISARIICCYIHDWPSGGSSARRLEMRPWPRKIYAPFSNNAFMKATTRKILFQIYPLIYLFFRGVRQLALLNLVRHHYIHEEYSAGRKVCALLFLWFVSWSMLSFCLKQSAYLEPAEIGLHYSNASGTCPLTVFEYHLDTFSVFFAAFRLSTVYRNPQ